MDLKGGVDFSNKNGRFGDMIITHSPITRTNHVSINLVPEYVDKLIIWSLQLTSKPMETPPSKKRGKQVGTKIVTSRKGEECA